MKAILRTLCGCTKETTIAENFPSLLIQITTPITITVNTATAGLFPSLTSSIYAQRKFEFEGVDSNRVAHYREIYENYILPEPQKQQCSHQNQKTIQGFSSDYVECINCGAKIK
jgi:regulatory protein YycI of two-component signal transduction system YycFG